MTVVEMVSALVALAVRPWLWGPAFRLLPLFRARGFGGYLRFRRETMYGGEGSFRADDLIAYLKWCRRMRVLAR